MFTLFYAHCRALSAAAAPQPLYPAPAVKRGQWMCCCPLVRFALNPDGIDHSFPSFSSSGLSRLPYGKAMFMRFAADGNCEGEEEEALPLCVSFRPILGVVNNRPLPSTSTPLYVRDVTMVSSGPDVCPEKCCCHSTAWPKRILERSRWPKWRWANKQSSQTRNITNRPRGVGQRLFVIWWTAGLVAPQCSLPMRSTW